MRKPKLILSGIILVCTISVALFFMLYSCKKEGNQGTLTVKFAGYVGNEPLSFVDSIYADGLGNEFDFQTLQMYIAHFSLVKSNDSLVEIDPVAYFNYSDPNWFSFTVNAPAGSYKGILFHFGLDTAQNSTLPQNYPATNPLGPQTNMFWGAMKHRFMALEGRADAVPSDSFVHATGLVYHVGTDTCYRSVTINGPAFTIVAGTTNQMNLNLDLLKIFYQPNDTLNMILYPGTQSLSNDLPIAIKFSNQITKAFSYSQ